MKLLRSITKLLSGSVILICFSVIVLSSEANNYQSLVPDQINAIAWDNRGQHIATGQPDGTVKIWDAISETTVIELKGHTGWISRVAWNYDDTQLASISLDNTARVWDASTGNNTGTFQHPASDVVDLSAVLWTPDGSRILTGGAEGTTTLFVWDTATQKLLSSRFAGTVGDLIYNPDRTRIALASIAGTTILDSESLEILANYEEQRKGDRGKRVTLTAIAWHPSEDILVTGNAFGTVRVRQSITGEILQEFNATDLPSVNSTSKFVLGLRFSPDGSLLQSVTADGTIRLWKVATGELAGEFSTKGMIRNAVWSPYAGRLAFSYMDSNAETTTTSDQQGNMLQIAVPLPSLDRVKQLAAICLADTASLQIRTTETLSTENLTTTNLAGWLEDIQALPADAIPAACAADLIAVAEAVMAPGS